MPLFIESRENFFGVLLWFNLAEDLLDLSLLINQKRHAMIAM